MMLEAGGVIVSMLWSGESDGLWLQADISSMILIIIPRGAYFPHLPHHMLSTP